VCRVGGVLSDELISRLEESYRLCVCVCVCVISKPQNRRSCPIRGRRAQKTEGYEVFNVLE
jgi:hypothetical protein